MASFVLPEILEHKRLTFETSPSIIGGSITFTNPLNKDIIAYSQPTSSEYPTAVGFYGPYMQNGKEYWIVDIPPQDTPIS